jgi:hypothetical protein
VDDSTPFETYDPPRSTGSMNFRSTATTSLNWFVIPVRALRRKNADHCACLVGSFANVVGVHGFRIEDDSIVHHGRCRHLLEHSDQIFFFRRTESEEI